MELEFSFRRYFDEKHSRYEDDISPGIKFKDVPDEAESIAVIMEDPDADGEGAFTHWIIWNIDPEAELDEGVPKEGEFESGAVQGVNDFGETGYAGPKPPPGATHEYVIAAYALDKELGLPPHSTKQELELEIQDHVIDKAERRIPYGRDFDSSKEAL